jgi:hypothetical protein
MRIELTIDHLILDGIANHRHAQAIHDALRAELSTLLATTSSPWRPRHLRRIEAPAVHSGVPADLGRQLAQSIHSGLAVSTRRSRS